MLVAPHRLAILAGAVHTDGHDIAVDQPAAVVAPFVVVVVTEKPGAVGEPLVHLFATNAIRSVYLAIEAGEIDPTDYVDEDSNLRPREAQLTYTRPHNP